MLANKCIFDKPEKESSGKSINAKTEKLVKT